MAAKKSKELEVIVKSYDLVVWSSGHIGKFPRIHRFTLGERLFQRLHDFLELLLKAKYSKQRAELLVSANLELELLRFQFRLARDLQCLPNKSYLFAARSLNEIGKLAGAWLKQARRGWPNSGNLF